MTKMIMASAALAGLMANAPRALAGPVRAEAPNVSATIAELRSAFEAFKTAQDEKLSAKVDDVLLTEKVERIDASIAELQAAADEHARLIAAAKLGGAGVGDLPGSDPAYVDGFKAFMRKGDESVVSAALTKGTDADGGFTAPVEWDRTVVEKLKLQSPIRENARVVAISGTGFRKLTSDRNVGSGWVGETAARPETATPTFGAINFTTGELYANPAISQQLLDDSAIDLEQWLADEVQTEFARQENIAFLSGNGVNKPNGILTYVTGGANAAAHPYGAIGVTSSGNASTLGNGDAVIDLVGSLPSQFAAGAKFYMSRLTTTGVRKLKDGQGNYLWQPSYALGQPQTLGGYPIVEVPDMPAVAANAIVALFGDMDATYLVVDRVGIRVLRDPYSNKPFVMFYTTKRVGGGVHNPEAMKALRIAA